MFAHWIKDYIDRFDFEEGRDYTRTVAKTGIRSNVTQIDYFLTLDMAKELAMLARSPKGKQARQYFKVTASVIRTEWLADCPSN